MYLIFKSKTSATTTCKKHTHSLLHEGDIEIITYLRNVGRNVIRYFRVIEDEKNYFWDKFRKGFSIHL